MPTKIHTRLQALQIKLHAESKRGVLIVLQAMDAGGKDGTIRKVFGPLNPHWVRVSDFKAPTGSDLARDYLWRIHRAIPKRGTIGIFNRSYYEDVLIARVNNLADRSTINQRYDQINAFETHLTENGYTVIKFYLHISKAEQRERLQARLDEPDKRWKFNPSDLEVRQRWNAYMTAYGKAITNCNQPCAPWHLIPADRKWARNVLVGRIVLAHLEAMDLKIPDPDLSHITIK